MLQNQKVDAMVEETSTCTSLDDSLSSGYSLQSAHATTKGVIEPSMVTLEEGPVSDVAPDTRSKNGEDRKVSFKHVHVKEFDRVIGDNPACSFGVPIS